MNMNMFYRRSFVAILVLLPDRTWQRIAAEWTATDFKADRLGRSPQAHNTEIDEFRTGDRLGLKAEAHTPNKKLARKRRILNPGPQAHDRTRQIVGPFRTSFGSVARGEQH